MIKIHETENKQSFKKNQKEILGINQIVLQFESKNELIKENNM